MAKPTALTMEQLLTDMSRRVGVLERRGGGGGGLASVASDADLAALLAARQPSAQSPLAIMDTRTGRNAVRVTKDGVLWSTTKPEPPPYIYPALGTGVTVWGGVYHRPGYMRTSAGIVSLTGLTRVDANGRVIFTLPAGYRPSAKWMFLVATGDVTGRLEITASGDVIASGITAGSYVSLDGIMFPSADVAPESAWTPITNWGVGWSDYRTLDPSWASAAWWQDVCGRMWVRGLARGPGSVLASDQPMFGVPGPPSGHFHAAGVGSSLFASLDGLPSGALFPYTDQCIMRAKAGVTSGWVSLAGLMYTPATRRPLSDWWPLAPLLGGWSDYGGFPGSSMLVHDDGIATLEGLVSGGTIGTTGTMFWFPEGYRPDITPWANLGRSGAQLYPVNTASGFGRTDLAVTNYGANPGQFQFINYGGTSNTWRSLHGINYVIGG